MTPTVLRLSAYARPSCARTQWFFNRKAKLLTKYLRVVLEPIPYAIFWDHRGFWRPTLNFYARDSVHLNSLGQWISGPDVLQET